MGEKEKNAPKPDNGRGGKNPRFEEGF